MSREQGETEYSNERSGESTRQTLEPLVVDFGFIETPELIQLREQLAEAVGTPSEAIVLISSYQDQAMELITENATEGVKYGLMVQEALLYYDAHLPEEGLHSLRLAYIYAGNVGDSLADAAEVLKPMIATTRLIDQASMGDVLAVDSHQLADICREELSADDCDFMASLPLRRALNMAVILLLEHGHKDPEGFLQSRGFLA